ncbi:DUF3810 domain-containing protein [Cellulophaga baltica]|uniref:DUF3810 domain-containing protein n=1 Tax=Cellulophaga TaxID=104264 RepID=UPI001C06B9E2|nr:MULTISPECIES: DUF3810 domain-containing protein [Cellulophaga]MBU2996514.1 DUF3810 domain-containing protein [Cellulophaga baltica]MDO6767908.1 DUF3810 domain-containing protein [Cellulophaga sp. 1_MG-2023]
MKGNFKNIIALSIVPQILFIKWISHYPNLIERYYSDNLYNYISKFFRFLFGWIPFSIGDILYAILIILAIRYVFVKRKYIWDNKLIFLRNILFVLAVAYFTFHISWGLNYYREPIASKLNITENHDKEDLLDFVTLLISKTNEAQVAITNDSTKMVKNPYLNKVIFKKTIEGYARLKKIHPFLKYEQPSTKESLFSIGLSYMGYGGYLNPFTNEAQVNSLVPNFRFPVIAGHEMGHQIGYSAENETNLIGYLVTLNNDDRYFKYSAYAYALNYCLRDIKRNDKEAFEKLLLQINPGVKKNYQELAAFWKQYENVTEPIFKAIFSSFLKANNQKDGIESYSRVVLLLVSYHQKHPL